MLTKMSQFLTTSLVLIWLITTYLLSVNTTTTIPQLILSIVSLFALSILLIRGASKFSAVTGKVLIVMGVLVIATNIINSHPITLSTGFIIPLMALATGLYIERINPHQRLYTWMFLGISAKVELLLITALITTHANTYTMLSMQWWWLVLACMIAGIPLLIFCKFYWYRILVFITTFIAFCLTLNILISTSWSPYLLILTLVAFLWPVITMRTVGRKVFKAES